ncbi:glycosyltransferase family 1 protein [Rhizobium sp. FY34]|uniref:glycosyltransferase family 4 protein n=1 Tax=Rhizobium sp. FY34 TaxID=2562309 RepID=UPI0010BF7B77|nr:glycosyltransferase family 1 protein [Rhizobium sp. FY34]
MELVLANELFSAPDRLVVGVLPTAWGIRIYEAERVRRGLRELEAMWAENQSHEHDLRLAALVERLNGHHENPGVSQQNRKPMSFFTRLRRMLRLIGATGFSFGRSAKKCLPQGTVYLNIGQIMLAIPILMRWLKKRPDITPVFMLHDVIPLDMPDHVAPSSVRHHARMIKTTADYAQALIVTTEHVRQTVSSAIARHRESALPTLAQALPVADVFSSTSSVASELSTSRYFVVCGSIEPRKNHLLLLDVWRKLVAAAGSSAPHLVIVGSIGWNGADILDRFEKCDATRGHIHPISGLSSPALTNLLQGAVALLMPSLNEGFGLPVVEARKLGVPVIVSDIPAHREVAGADACFLPTDDVTGWAETIVNWVENGSPPVAANGSDEFISPRQYSTIVAGFLDQCAAMRSARYQTSDEFLADSGKADNCNYTPVLE